MLFCIRNKQIFAMLHTSLKNGVSILEQKMTKRVFFLGAGFSKAIIPSFPLMNELTNDVAQYFEKESIGHHYNKEVTKALKNNVEHLLTFLSTDLPWKTEVQKNADIALYHEITQQIQKRLIGLDNVTTEQMSPLVSSFFDYILNNYNSNSFITLNYDLLVEKLIVDAVYRRNAEAAVNVSDMYSYPMMWAGIRSFDGVGMFGSEEEKNLPKVIKLHGSLNWYWGAVTASDIVYYLSMEDVEKKKYQITSGLKPYIIPPVMDKNAFYDHVMIRHLWKSARELLREADEIYIIGFSMPQSDLSVKFLCQSALEHNNSKVFIVNTQGKKDLCDKYADLCRSIDYRYAGKQEAVQLMMENILSDC